MSGKKGRGNYVVHPMARASIEITPTTTEEEIVEMLRAYKQQHAEQHALIARMMDPPTDSTEPTP